MILVKLLCGWFDFYVKNNEYFGITIMEIIVKENENSGVRWFLDFYKRSIIIRLKQVVL